jgi:metal transporter CNNM
LKELLALHKDNKELEEDEVRILGGALDFAERQVTEVMTPIKKVFQLEIHEKLNVDNLTKVFKSGFSRIPCYDKTVEHDNIRGIIFVKDMILLDPKVACVP